VIFAPRRYGKSSLVWRASQELIAAGSVLIAQVDLMATPSKEKLAEKLAKSIYEDIASTVFKVREKATSIFSGLRIVPRITLDPYDGTLGFSFDATSRREDIDATLERLFELPAQLATDQKKRAALVIDEFQEVLDIDPNLPSLMRSVFQKQPEVAHIYLGSKRSMMERIFNDENEPFWRSAKKMELGVIPPEKFGPFIKERFDETDRGIGDDLIEQVLEITHGHPYATQELCYFLWEEVLEGRPAGEEALADALTRVLRSESAHFSLIWDKASRGQRLLLQALAKEPTAEISRRFRDRYGLPTDAAVRKSLRALADDELVSLGPPEYRISEPFLAEWILRYTS
jgi:uncharacterized protein